MKLKGSLSPEEIASAIEKTALELEREGVAALVDREPNLESAHERLELPLDQ